MTASFIDRMRHGVPSSHVTAPSAMSKPADRTIRILLVGDISLGGDFADLVARAGATWTSPFAEIMPLFRTADVRVGNLESPLFKSP